MTGIVFEYRLNPAAKTKTIDLVTPNGLPLDMSLVFDQVGLSYYGIYQLKGNQLKICTSSLSPVHHTLLGAPGSEAGATDQPARPSQFWAELGSGKELLVLRRVGDAVVTEDEKAIQEGTWRLENVPEEHSDLFLGMQFKFSHREVAISTPGMPDGIALSCGYALDPTAKPKRIDSWSCGPNAIFFQPVHGIYSLDGNRLKIAFAFTPNKDMNFGPLPPSKLAAGPKTSVVVFGRVMKGEEMLVRTGADLFRPDRSEPAKQFNREREMIEDGAKAMGIPPADVPEKMSQGIMDMMFQDAFRVSAEESVQMEKGRLDRAAIKREITEDIKALGQMHAELPGVAQRVVNRFLAGKTNADMELEYTRRFLKGFRTKLKKLKDAVDQAGKKEPEEPKPKAPEKPAFKPDAPAAKPNGTVLLYEVDPDSPPAGTTAPDRDKLVTAIHRQIAATTSWS